MIAVYAMRQPLLTQKSHAALKLQVLIDTTALIPFHADFIAIIRERQGGQGKVKCLPAHLITFRIGQSSLGVWCV